MECENSQTSETRNNSTDSTNTSTLVDTEATNDDTSVSESNYSGTASEFYIILLDFVRIVSFPGTNEGTRTRSPFG